MGITQYSTSPSLRERLILLNRTSSPSRAERIFAVTSCETAEVKPAGLIAQIAFIFLLLVVFTIFPDRIIFGAYYDQGWHVIPSILSPAFFSIYLPLMEIRWGLTIVLNLVLLRQMRWQLGTSLAALFLEIFDIYILIRLVSGPSIINLHHWENLIPGLPFVPVPPVDAALRLALRWHWW